MRCSAVLLAGGKSTRMGRDKALLEIEGEPLWQRQLATLRQLSPVQLLVSGPPRPGAEAVADRFAGAGPLAGLEAALQKAVAPLLVVLAIDLPHITPAFLRSLLDLCREDRGAVPCGPKFYEPLAAVYPTTLRETAEEALRAGNFSLQQFVAGAVRARQLVRREILPTESHLFTNLNSPADL